MERRAIEVRGIVQGVGFRPFVYGLAARHSLGGFVRNRAGTLLIEVEGEPPALERFLAELADRPPPLAHIEALSWEAQPTCGDRRFRIEDSDPGGPGEVFVSPDVAACADCLAELFDPADRRFGYPFLNCTNCGPRLTIITGAPYDRARTTMAGFAMCPACRAEYDDPTNRRFHAQPTACPACGPQLRLLDAAGQLIFAPDPVAHFAQALLAGRIGALKGLGGYHLACDARNPAAVAELRRRKYRDEKPFAVMVADIAAAESLCEVGPAERELLLSPPAPIVLLRKRGDLTPRPPSLGRKGEKKAPSPPGGGGWGRGPAADLVAPGNLWLGVMLPYTPLHHLLMRAGGGVPLVMTSGNHSDEPIAYRDDAAERLAGIADLFLTHDRPIHVRCDDSVTRVVDGLELPVRRSRGYAPRPVPLPFDCPSPILAVGGQLKATFALAQGRQAFLSHHLGDLDHLEAYRAFEHDLELYTQLVGITPDAVACDQHPDYATSCYAREFCARLGKPLLSVQHHHAHVASCMAENQLIEPVIGVAFDGTGFGPDGAVWGGEFLTADYGQFRRAGHLRYVGLPGGDRAVREPWRMAVAHLADAGLDDGPLQSRVASADRRLVRAMLERGLNSPLTSSAGRLFDAVAALAGVRDRVSYEGQAAVELEGLATDTEADGSYPFDITGVTEGEPPEPVWVGDTRPLIRTIAADAGAGTEPRVIARRFHTTLADIIAAVCDRVRADTGLETVVLSGGVFVNALLTVEVSTRLREAGFRVYRHRLVPPGDGGLALGQLAVAAHHVQREGG